MVTSSGGDTMLPPRVTSRLRPTNPLPVLALLTGLLVLAPAVIADTVESPVGRLDLRSDAIEETLTLLRSSKPLAAQFADEPQMDVAMTFTHPIVRGHDDVIAALYVKPKGNASWSGTWWAESSAGSTPPTKVVIPAEGRFIDVRGGKYATSDEVHVVFRFVGQDGAKWMHAAGPVQVIRGPPDMDTVRIGGAAASEDHALFSVWNLLGHDAIVGYRLLDANGTVASEAPIRSCDGTRVETEHGCRITFITPTGASTLAVWHELANGTRLVTETISLATLADEPVVASLPPSEEPAPTLGLGLVIQ